MRFNDSYFNKDERFSIGIEESSGKFYISIPVSNGMVDYEEYFEIDKNTFESYMKNPGLALPFVMRCRNREVDNLLIIQPGRDRGVAT
ncbi:hypothetical protein M8R19_21580 [Pseudomonas sp. R3.Fl]|uniref:hypothetical protein n=1 Tax=Pseudomonas TaxID=286 RepID=UPI0009450052|nr:MULTISPECIES: hypothetical protein [Pseudomonas]MCL6691297.1 hypothetical protein [Pseudomonas sp. R3.Fl]TGC27253.1 hypothetical protein CW310_17055 [Pseudomonas citronellolis]UUC49343.1 hypothetical protein NOX82_26225 [Pseudomonas citronellolis]